jgi:hypothetical protein
VKRCAALLVVAACATARPAGRPEFRDCSAAGDGDIVCGGKPAAHVECFLPRSDSCRALAIRYASGERVFLYRPTGFDPDSPEASPSEDVGAALQPEMARDGSLIWFKATDSEAWSTFDPATGAIGSADSTKVVQLRASQADGPVELSPH